MSIEDEVEYNKQIIEEIQSHASFDGVEDRNSTPCKDLEKCLCKGFLWQYKGVIYFVEYAEYEKEYTLYYQSEEKIEYHNSLEEALEKYNRFSFYGKINENFETKETFETKSILQKANILAFGMPIWVFMNWKYFDSLGETLAYVARQ